MSRVATLRFVERQFTDYGFQTYGEPVRVEVELQPDERIAGVEWRHDVKGLSDLALFGRVLIEKTAGTDR